MTEIATSIRLPEEFIRRADLLAQKLRHKPEMSAMGELTRSKVIRLAIAKGLETLEEQEFFSENPYQARSLGELFDKLNTHPPASPRSMADILEQVADERASWGDDG